MQYIIITYRLQYTLLTVKKKNRIITKKIVFVFNNYNKLYVDRF